MLRIFRKKYGGGAPLSLRQFVVYDGPTPSSYKISRVPPQCNAASSAAIQCSKFRRNAMQQVSFSHLHLHRSLSGDRESEINTRSDMSKVEHDTVAIKSGHRRMGRGGGGGEATERTLWVHIFKLPTDIYTAEKGRGG